MRRAILAIVSTVAALVMLLSFKTHSSSSLATPPAAVSTTTSGSTSTGGSGGSSSATTTKRSHPKSTASTSSTVTGAAAMTQYGPVQVKITVKSGTITAANAVVYPQSDPRDQQINSFAIPALDQEATQASSASIDTISGATYTSEGYISSLQSALDKVKS